MKSQPTTYASTPATLINYLEVWTLPQPIGGDVSSELKLDSAIAISEDEVRTVELAQQSLTKGAGIAGSAWQQGSAVILAGQHSAVIQAAAQESGQPVRALLAIPVYRDFQLINVVVFGLTNGNGGLEIWSRDDRDELAIGGSYYQGLESFEYISQHVRFPKGAGLPGNAWKNNRPGFLNAPDTNPNFIRSFDRDPASITECIGLPIGREYGFPASILLLLSDKTTPLAKLIDVWQLESGSDGTTQFGESKNQNTSFDPAWCRQICDRLQPHPGVLLLDQSSHDLPEGSRFGIVIPFFDGKQITDVFTMLF